MLITRQSTEGYARREAGGKGYNLYRLTRSGFDVPEWRIIGARLLRDYLARSGIGQDIESDLSRLGHPNSYKDAAGAIHVRFTHGPLPAEVESEIRDAYRSLGKPLIAVRSSGLDEDGARQSFAGQLSTFLYVKDEEAAVKAVRECWASAFSERGLSYRAQSGLRISAGIAVAVVLQEMVDPERSGVLFTCEPISGDPARVTVNAVHGVGEGLVSGLLAADSWVLDKADGRVLSQEIGEKESRLVRDSEQGGTREQALEPGQGSLPCLGPEDLRRLAELGRRIERLYRRPQDVEWALKDGKLHVLQSRPVTTPVREGSGKLFIWDNSNIVESYGGLTRPLTFTFAHYVYHQVYVQFCEILLVPQREIRNMDYFLRNMLGIFYGRVYYNLLNWYKLTSILPGFKFNREFMETMMGTHEGLASEIADRIKPPGFSESLSSRLRRAVTGFKFLWYHWTAQGMVDGFLAYFHRVYERYRDTDFGRMTADEILDTYRELERLLLREWKAPIINDFLCMVHFGVLKKLTTLWLGGDAASLQNDLLCGEGNLESAEPTRELIRMAAEAAADPGLKLLIETARPEDALEALTQAASGSDAPSPHRAFLARVDSYIRKYGFRCMNEMKLEQKDLHQDPSFLFVCLKNYLRSGQLDLEAYERREKEVRASAEARARALLPWSRPFKRVVYFWSLKHARRAVRNRENTRFCRTRIYGLVRRMFFAIGRDFADRGIIDRAEDLFYLTLQELTGSLEGVLTTQNLRPLIELRRTEYSGYEKIEPLPRFMTRGPVYWLNDHTGEARGQGPGEAGLAPLGPDELRGTGCCPGVVEGTVKVVLSPDDDMELNGEILVTLRTDPGWIPLYPAVSGLLVERGGLLSHSAIVAREMGLPTVVGVRGLTERLKSGMRVRFNGQTGEIRIL
jgi:phosphohistidine swiveling domain-containing protein